MGKTTRETEMIRSTRQADGTWTTVIDDPTPTARPATTYDLRTDRSTVRVDLGGRTVYTGLLGEDTDEEPCDYCPDGMPCLCASDSVDPLD